jgi:hypothetical protein
LQVAVPQQLTELAPNALLQRADSGPQRAEIGRRVRIDVSDLELTPEEFEERYLTR